MNSEMTRNEIVAVGGEFQSPTVKLEIVDSSSPVSAVSSDCKRVARPRVVGGTLDNSYSRAI